MNKGRPGTAGASAFLVTFLASKKSPADGIRGQPKSTFISSLINIYQTLSFDLPPAIAATIAPKGWWLPFFKGKGSALRPQSHTPTKSVDSQNRTSFDF
jgi:hypothetical protein